MNATSNSAQSLGAKLTDVSTNDLLELIKFRGHVVADFFADDLACYVESYPDERLGEVEWADIAAFLQGEFKKIEEEGLEDKLHQVAFNEIDRIIETNGFHGRLKAWLEAKLKGEA